MVLDDGAWPVVIASSQSIASRRCGELDAIGHPP
jgi:hypothetical protein